MSLTPENINSSWTLFLDRDGVINKRLIDDYVRTPEEFEFLPFVPQAIQKLSELFGRIVVVTNQQGIGKGLYTVSDLEKIHHKMKQEVESAMGKIDAVYFAPQLSSENSPMRKPGIGMALKAREDFPSIDFAKSVMVGDSSSDMIFARAAGMYAVLCTDENINCKFDLRFKSLMEFADFLSRRGK